MATSAVCVQGLRGPALLPSWRSVQKGTPLFKSGKVLAPRAAPLSNAQGIRAAKKESDRQFYSQPTIGNQGQSKVGGSGTKSVSGGGTKLVPGSGTKSVFGKKVKVVEEGDKSAKYRNKVSGEPKAAIKLLSRVEELRLLSKVEKAGLLSAVENAGLSLSSIEKLGLLSKAEKFGALSAATDRNTPQFLKGAALGLLLIGPAFVYFVPEDSAPLVVLQFVVAFISILGGSAAFAASSFVSALQSSD